MSSRSAEREKYRFTASIPKRNGRFPSFVIIIYFDFNPLFHVNVVKVGKTQNVVHHIPKLLLDSTAEIGIRCRTAVTVNRTRQLTDFLKQLEDIVLFVPRIVIYFL